MNENELFEILNELDDSILEQSEAEIKKKKKPLWVKCVTITAASLILVAGIGCLAVFTPIGRNILYKVSGLWKNNKVGGYGGAGEGGAGIDLNNGGNSADPLKYSAYSGPVFPLFTLEENADITAERNVNFAFSPYGNETRTITIETIDGSAVRSADIFNTKSYVTDSFILSNESGSDKEITCFYPFVADLNSDKTEIPVIYVDGQKIESELKIGPYTGSFSGVEGDSDDSSFYNLSGLDSWEDYKKVIENGYFDKVIDEIPELNKQVVVYEIKIKFAENTEDKKVYHLNFGFNSDGYDYTDILTFRFNGSKIDSKSGYYAFSKHISFSHSSGNEESAYLIMLGDDIGEYRIETDEGGNHSDVFSYTVERTECALGEIIGKLYDQFYIESDQTIQSTLPKETCLKLLAEMMQDEALWKNLMEHRYAGGHLEMAFSDLKVMDRIMYVSFKASIPANGKTSIKAEMYKSSSSYYPYGNMNTIGYDMVTQTGSNLSFTKQTASVSDTGYVKIVRQDFGFDIQNGVDSVELDPNIPHYYIEVSRK